ncbi:MAG TPA: ribbon-helix-helix protein, CopG family [Gemmatimonadota bacterium]|nr:ribbon-helix-helix protein, CopG family [Gemmatimonadota bacterium]
MRTTLNLDDEVMRALRRRAAETGRTLTSLVEEALRSMLEGDSRPDPEYRLEWTVVPGGARPGVDLSDRDALLDIMDDRR